MRINPILALSCFWIAACGTAVAQAPPTGPSPKVTPSAAGTNGCAPMQPAPHAGAPAPEGTTTTGQSRQPLGEKLAQSDGVLCPPSGVDPEIRAPTPDTGNTPVIPPPGSPGGDPRIRPK
jgi:hypothetical protein